MIRNIVFDLGGVYFQGDKIENFISRTFGVTLIESKEFSKKYNEAALSEETSKRFWLWVKCCLKSSHSWISIRNRFLDSIKPDKKIINLIRNLRNCGYKIYFLSNSHIDIHPFLEEKYKFSDEFDGGILSHKEPFYKPDIRIYEELLRRFRLKSDECIFIDDIEKNLEPAKELCMNAILYRNLNELSRQINSVTKMVNEK